jgi:hypothetical protein
MTTNLPPAKRTTTMVDGAALGTACLDKATTMVNPALSIIGLLPTPQQRTTALLALLRAEVERSGNRHPVISNVCLPATEVISINAMASVDTVIWRCRLCDHHGTTTTRPPAHSEGIEHLTTEHHATIGTTPEKPPAGRQLSPLPRVQCSPRPAGPQTHRFLKPR